MVKHNNVVPNRHFHKDWQVRVRTWFDQPGKKRSRRLKRDQKVRPPSNAVCGTAGWLRVFFLSGALPCCRLRLFSRGP